MAYNISHKGLDFIAKWEGFSPTMYLDAAELPTIGFGHLIRKGEVFSTMTRKDAIELLRKDAHIAVEAVNRLVKVALTQNQFDALVSFVFNLGATAFKDSTLLKHINANRHSKTEQEFMKWVYAGGKKRPGLINRRKEEAALYLS